MRKKLVCLSTAVFMLLSPLKVCGMESNSSDVNNIIDITQSIMKSYKNLSNFEFPEGKIDYLTNSINPSLKHKKARNIIGGKGSLLFTDNGEMIDMASMTVNCILGQNDDWVKSNLIAYNLTNQPSFHSTSFGSYMYYNYAKRLHNIKIANIENPVINHRQCNGSDVTELAILSAKNVHPERKKVVSFGGSYHGQNLTAYTVSEVQLKNKFMFKNIEDENVILGVPSNANTIDPTSTYLTPNDQKIINDLENIADDVYAVILEPIQGNNGLNMFSRGLLNKVREVCNKHDICLIFDEAQTGWGWLGKMSAAEVYNVTPDISAFSKAVTSGYGPLSIMVTSPKYAYQPYGTAEKTNGGDLRSLVSANAVLDRLLGLSTNSLLCADSISNLPSNLQNSLSKGLLVESFDTISNYLSTKLEKLKACSCKVGDLKGYGLVRGFEILNSNGEPDKALTSKFVDECYEAGVFVKSSNNTIMLRPSLVIDKVQMDKAFEVFTDVLNRI